MYATYPYLGLLKIVIPAEMGRIGCWAVMFATVWFQLFNHVSPRSVLKAKSMS